MLEGMDNVFYSSGNVVHGGGSRHGDFGWEPLKCVTDPGCMVFGDPDV